MDGQEKSPVSDSLAAHETGLGFELANEIATVWRR